MANYLSDYSNGFIEKNKWGELFERIKVLPIHGQNTSVQIFFEYFERRGIRQRFPHEQVTNV